MYEILLWGGSLALLSILVTYLFVLYRLNKRLRDYLNAPTLELDYQLDAPWWWQFAVTRNKKDLEIIKNYFFSVDIEEIKRLALIARPTSLDVGMNVFRFLVNTCVELQMHPDAFWPAVVSSIALIDKGRHHIVLLVNAEGTFYMIDMFAKDPRLKFCNFALAKEYWKFEIVKEPINGFWHKVKR